MTPTDPSSARLGNASASALAANAATMPMRGADVESSATPSPATSASPATVPTASDERRCEVCGNLYDKAFRVVHGGRTHVFDCFECAIHALAPTCAGCGCRIVGHGMESDGVMYCCAHCAQRSGIGGLKDRADATLPAS
jgi:hypothetical protein